MTMPEDDLPPENLGDALKAVVDHDMQKPYSCSYSRIVSGEGTDADFRFYKAVQQFLDSRDLEEQLKGEADEPRTRPADPAAPAEEGA